MLRAEHRLAKIAVAALPARQPLTLRRLGARQRLLRAVIDTWNTQTEQLQRHGCCDLVLARGFARESNLVAIDVIVVVEDGDVPLAQVAVRAHALGVRIETAEIILRRPEALGDTV